MTNKKDKKKSKDFSSYKITLITITQWCRKDWTDLLFRCVKNQTGIKYVIDYVILDGSKNNEDQDKLKEHILNLNKTYNLPISYYDTKSRENRTIGWLRNEAHTKLKQETTHCIVLDDDDYQFPTRILETIKLFDKKKCNLIGTNSQYLYHHDTGHIFRFRDGVFGNNHSVNSCLAYSVEYLKDNKYDDSLPRSEEPSFLKHFKNPMEQLDPNHSIIGLSYGEYNTYNKSIINQQNVIFKDLNPENTSAFLLDKSLKDFMGKKLADEYLSIMDNYEYSLISNYDITYYTGFLAPPWSHKSEKLGGSESAVIQLCKNWVKLGKKVEVYCYDPELEHIPSYVEFEGIHIYHTNKFKFRTTYNNLILWRFSGMTILNDSFRIKANSIYVDLHDHNPQDMAMIISHQNKIDKVFYKSQFHSAIADHEYPFFKEFPTNKRVFIQNGLELETFKKDYGVQRDKYRFQYSSSYFRGLKGILKYSVPIIFKAEPRFELHVYYGMDIVPSKEEGDEIRMLLSQEGVLDHGRQNKEIVAREKQRATYHLYPTNTTSEICCISLKESMASGCIPIVSNVNIFSTFAGIHITWDEGMSEEDYYKRVGESVVDVLKHITDSQLEELSKAMKSNDMVKSWEQVSKLWLEYF